MEAFNDFSLTNPEAIVGGTLVPTQYEGEDGSSGSDRYDTTRKRVIYVN
ncbi:hypothetical protein [Neolewinella persica]|nr:hypothetical protein [Neolewinella persica]